MERRDTKTGRERLRRAAGLMRELSGAELGLYAASGAYFLFLSLIPLAALACSLLPITPLTRETVLEYLGTILPDVMEQLLQEVVEQVYMSGAAAISLSALLTLWSAGRALTGLIRGLDRICGAPESRSALGLRLRSCVYTLGLVTLMILSLSLVLFQRRLIRLLAAAWPEGGAFLAFLLQLRYLLAMLLLALCFALLYTFLPAGRRRLGRQFPGAMLTSLLWMLLTWLFTDYVQRAGGTSVYGSLATAVFGLLWIYLCMYILLLGAWVNVRLEAGRET